MRALLIARLTQGGAEVTAVHNRHLETFVKVVKLGSFSKAASEMFISTNAVAKQINALESSVGVALLTRTPTGVTPTPAGTCLLKHAVSLISASRRALAEVREAAGEGPAIVRLGASVFRPATTTGHLWYAVAEEHPGIRLDIVKLPDDIMSMRKIYSTMGKEVDVVVAITPSLGSDWMQNCRTRLLYESPLCVLVPLMHPLASRERLMASDLYGESISMAGPEVSPHMASFHDYIALAHPRIIPDIRLPYDLDEVNRCFSACQLMLSCREWDNVHPGMVNKEVQWGTWGNTIGMSAVYAVDAPPAVLEFIDAVCLQRQRLLKKQG